MFLNEDANDRSDDEGKHGSALTAKDLKMVSSLILRISCKTKTSIFFVIYVTTCG